MKYVQIGIAQMRDKVTGEPIKEKIPIYAKASDKTVGLINNDTAAEAIKVEDIAGIFAKKFAKYVKLTKTVEKRR